MLTFEQFKVWRKIYDVSPEIADSILRAVDNWKNNGNWNGWPLWVKYDAKDLLECPQKLEERYFKNCYKEKGEM